MSSQDIRPRYEPAKADMRRTCRQLVAYIWRIWGGYCMTNIWRYVADLIWWRHVTTIRQICGGDDMYMGQTYCEFVVNVWQSRSCGSHAVCLCRGDMAVMWILGRQGMVRCRSWGQKYWGTILVKSFSLCLLLCHGIGRFARVSSEFSWKSFIHAIYSSSWSRI